MSYALKTNRSLRREKCFGTGKPRPMDRNAKVRIMVRARALMRATEKGKHYGQVTAKTMAVLEALLWQFHNRHTGLCFPGYDTIAAVAGCARSTVALAIKRLESAGVMTWVNRLKRENGRVLRTSNGYRFFDFGAAASKQPRLTRGTNVISVDFSSKSENMSRTANQVSFSFEEEPRRCESTPKIHISDELRSIMMEIARNKSEI